MARRKLLLIAPTPNLRELFSSMPYDITWMNTATRGKQALSDLDFDFIIIQSPLVDESAIQTANELSGLYGKHILLLVEMNNLDQASFLTQEQQVFVLPSSAGKVTILQAADFLEKSAQRQKRLEKALAREKQRFQEEKLIAYCKIRLVETCSWSEQKAHDYILKTAMDHSMTKSAAAKLLLRRIEILSNES